MRSISIAAGALIVLMTTSCGGGGTTERDIVNSLNNTLNEIAQSAAGDWGGLTGIASGSNTIRLDFRLQAGVNGQVSGTGTMKEANAPSAVPITVSGTYQRPTLTLTIDGMVYESRQVKGAFQGDYTSVAGILAPLTLTAPGYSREFSLLLQEK
jgi:hypothetical protein